MAEPPPPPVILHASCVALNGRAVLIRGASGQGKSALALQLMALGALLVSDDRTELRAEAGALLASAPAAIRGLIEARGVGLLRADASGPAPVALVVDLDRAEPARLPALHTTRLCGLDLPCLHKIDAAHFPAAIAQYLKAGRQEPA